MNAAQIGWSVSQMEMLTRTLKAIAHPARLSIIEMLENGKRLTVTEIYTRLKADQSAVSHHLSILRDKGILGTERKGKFIYYYLKNTAFLSLIDCLNQIQQAKAA
ncbi:MAG: metalloregulator ArsR/SmtB family transcription factor [Bacteroidia bacterium]|nr:metalloregulator ArsR/SmtB family transcription factor [Bacteroidia bacterium]